MVYGNRIVAGAVSRSEKPVKKPVTNEANKPEKVEVPEDKPKGRKKKNAD